MNTCEILILSLRRKNSGMEAKYLLAYVRVQIWEETSLEAVSTVFKTGGNYPNIKKRMQNNSQRTWTVSLLYIFIAKRSNVQ